MPADHVNDTGMRPAPEQVRLLIAQEIDRLSTAHNHSILLRLGRTVDPTRFRAAVEVVAARHDALRARFRRGGPDGWSVHIGPAALHETNVVILPDTELMARAQLETDRPFDLSRDAPMRVHWWHIGESIVCQLTFHHLATDAHTVDLLIEDLRRHYNAPQRMSSTATSYYTLAQPGRHPQTSTTYQEQLQAYRDRVGACELGPLLTAREGAQKSRAYLSWAVPADVDTAVRNLAQELGCTRFAVWLTAWTRSLARITGRWNMPVAVPISTRQSRTQLTTIGFFVNSIVVPVSHDRAEAFPSACRRIAGSILDALDSRHLPMQELANRLELAQRGLANPLTALSAQLLPAEQDTLALEGGSVSIEHLESTNPRYQLSFDIRETSRGSKARIVADLSHFEPARLTAFQPLIDQDILGRNHSTAITRRASERQAATKPVTTSILVEPLRQWRQYPDGTAVVWADGRWTWAQLRYAVDDIAARLVDRGVRKADAVTIEMPRGPFFVAALVAVLQLDAIPVMLRTGWQEPERKEVVQSVRATARILGPRRVQRVAAQPTSTNRDGSGLPAGTAYVTFTSGSTGRPKGVPAPIAGVLDYLNWIADITMIGPQDRCLQIAASGFDALVRDTLTPLRKRAAVVILPEEARLSGKAMAATVIRESVTAILAMIPSQLRLLLNHLHSGVPRIICVAGEPLFHHDVEQLQAIDSSSRLLNLYGPTETTMTSTFLEARDGLTHGSRLPVGHPLPHVQVHVLGPDGEQLPPGCTGEVVISGHGVAGGYLGEAGHGSNRFAMRHLDGKPQWSYATGDMGYWLSDHAGLRLEGRLDAERKVNGERIDLAAVEAALAEHPNVIDAIATVEHHGQLGMVTAHVLLQDPSMTTDDLRGFLDSRISAAAIPRRITAVDHIPRLENGKPDRATTLHAASGSTTFPHRQPSWVRVQQAVRAVLQQVPSNPETTLFELGADSLKIIEILELLALLRGSPESAMKVFDDPRLGNLTQLVDRAIALGPLEVDPLSEGGIFTPLNPDQRLATGDTTVVCFPPAGGDHVSFAPLARALHSTANIVVARRTADGRRDENPRAWADSHALTVARHLARNSEPIVLCGYSVGFVLACLTADALALNHGRTVHHLIGINPSTLGRVRDPKPSDVPEREPEHQTSGRWRRLTADLALRTADTRLTTDLPGLLLLQGKDDRHRWGREHTSSSMRFASISRHAIAGAHTLTAEEMFTAGTIIQKWMTGQDETAHENRP